MLPKLIVIAGTNASGKSGLGVELALRYAAKSFRRIRGRCFVDWTWAAAKSRPKRHGGSDTT